MKEKKRRGSLISLLFLGLVFFLFFWKFFLKGLIPIPADIIAGMYYPWLNNKWGYSVGVPVKNPIISDTVSQFWPWRNWAVNHLKNGKLAVWNPYSLAGYPLSPWFQTILFSPANLFYFLFNQTAAMGLIVSFQLLAGLILMFLFLKEITSNNLASLFGAISFSFSAFFLGWLTWGTVGWSASFLPLILLLIRKLIKGKKNSWCFLGLFLSVLFSFLGGHPQTFFYVFLSGAIYFLSYFLFQKKVFRKKAALIFLALFLALTATALVLLPSLEILKHSIRAHEDYIKTFNYGFLPFYKLIILIFAPNFFGSPSTGNYWGGGFNFQEYFAWFGSGAFVLALFFLIKKKSREEKEAFWPFTAIFFLGIFLSLKYPFGLLVYWLKIPLLSTVSASRALFLTAFAGSALSALGLKSLIEKKLSAREIKRVFLFWLVPAGGGSLGLLISFFIFKFLSFPGIEAWSPVFLQTIKVGFRNLVLPLGASGLTVFAFWFRNQFLKKQKGLVFLMGLGFVFLALLEGFYFGWKHTPFVKKELYFPETPAIEFLKTKYQEEGFFRVERTRGELLPPNMWVVFNFYSLSGYDPVYPLSYAQFLKKEKLMGDPSRYLEWERDNYFFNQGGVRYFLVLKRSPDGHPDYQGELPFWIDLKNWSLVFEEGPVAVLENKNFSPPFALLDKEKKPLKGEIELLAKKDDFWQFEVSSSELGFLVLRENFFPGWKAKINGQEKKVESFEEAFKKVEFGPGESEIVFYYQNNWLGLGFFLTGAAFLGAIMVFLKLLFNL